MHKRFIGIEYFFCYCSW